MRRDRTEADIITASDCKEYLRLLSKGVSLQVVSRYIKENNPELWEEISDKPFNESSAYIQSKLG